MAVCQRIPFPKPKSCIADLKHRIDIFPHTIVPPALGDTEYTIDKIPPLLSRWAAIKTQPNKAIFDGANQERTISHKIYIRYSPLVTSEHWIRKGTDFYNIVFTENIQELDEWLLMHCNIYGLEP